VPPPRPDPRLLRGLASTPRPRARRAHLDPARRDQGDGLPGRLHPAVPLPRLGPRRRRAPAALARRLTSWITTDPAKLPATRRTLLEHALQRCPELQAAAGHVRSFAALLTAGHDGDLHEHTTRLDYWIAVSGNGGAQTNEVTFTDNSIRQIDATLSGTSTGYFFNSGTNGSLTVKGTTDPQTVQAASSGTAVSAVPVITGTVYFPSAVPVLQATTGSSGFTLLDSTPTLLTWSVPNDGQVHRVIVLGELVVTTTQAGGEVQLVFNDPAGNSRTESMWAGGLGVGANKVNGNCAFMVGPDQTITLEQTSDQTSGSAIAYVDLWGI
jgi:hypothetical protein